MTKRAAIYARFSSDLQKATSIEDQVAMCRKHAERQGWQVVEVFTDSQKTGRNTRRPGFQKMKDAIYADRIDIVLVEALDRLNRKVSDALTQFELMAFRDVKLHSVTEGEQNFFTTMLIGFAAQQQSEVNGEHTRRGMKSAVGRRRLHTSTYGYRKVSVEEGLNREIVPEEAEIVRRIFTEYAEGRSALQIAKGLNADRIPAPRGGSWDGSTIRGNPARQEGILHNRIYIGIASICRHRRRYNPETGQRKIISSPEDYTETDIPELRIVPQDLWERVQAQRAGRKPMQNAVETRRTRYLLSGLLVCGCCGTRYVKHNRTSYRCREALKGGVCTNTRTISRRRIEARVFARLKQVMLSDELARQFSEALEVERRKLAKANPEADVKRLSAALTEAETKRERIFQAIEDGAPFATFKARASEVEAEIADLAARIERAKRLITLQHADQPDARLLYERAVAQMELLLGDEDLVEQAHAFLGELIRKIALRPDASAPHGVSAVIEARFGALLGVEEAVTDAAGFTMVPC